MSKSKSKSKKNSSNGSNAKNIKALINQNKMIERENAEAEKRKLEEEEARKAAKLAKEQAEQEAALETAKVVEADEVITPDAESEQITATEEKGKKDKKAESKESETSKEKDTKGKKDDKKGKKKKDKGEKRGLGKRIKETVSELKKISWPTFGTVVKKTGVVLAVVIFFAIVLFAFDLLLSVLYQLLVGADHITIV